MTIYLWLYRPLLDLGRFFSLLTFYIVGKTLWMGDQPVVMLYMHTEIHALSGIRTHDSSVRAGEDSLSLRPRAVTDPSSRPRGGPISKHGKVLEIT
jgi:hypothetical protein